MIVLALAGLLVLGGLVSWFISLQRAGRHNTVFAVLLSVVVVEAMVNSAANSVEEGGIFRPVVAGQDFRAPDLVIVAAVMAMALSSGTRGRVRFVAVAWTTFVLWYSAAAITGVANGNPVSEVLFHGKAMFYLAGGAIVASAVDVDALVNSDRWNRVRSILGTAGAVFVVGTLLGIGIHIGVPAVKVARLGTLSNDAITIVSSLGLMYLLMLAVRGERAMWPAICASLMLAAPLAGNQRANFVGAAASTVLVVLLATTRSWRSRVRVTPVEFGVFAAGLVLVGLVAVSVGGPKTDVLAKFDETFFAGVENQTAAVREEAWKQARGMIADRPLSGWGLGIEQNIGPVGRETWQAARTEAREIASHNLLIDVTLRTGFLGPVLFVMALVFSARDGLAVWFNHRRSEVAALAVTAMATMAAILGKGMVESVFEKFRLVVVFGMCIGLLSACRRSLDADEEMADRPVAVRTRT